MSMYERLLREKEQTDLPEHRKREVESSLYSSLLSNFLVI